MKTYQFLNTMIPGECPTHIIKLWRILQFEQVNDMYILKCLYMYNVLLDVIKCFKIRFLLEMEGHLACYIIHIHYWSFNTNMYTHKQCTHSSIVNSCQHFHRVFTHKDCVHQLLIHIKTFIQYTHRHCVHHLFY